MTITFVPLRWPDDAEAAIEFLTRNEWPYHGSPRLDRGQAGSVRVAGDDVAAFWLRTDGESIGLVRLLDLDDVETGSPLFDLRVADAHRNRGVGRAAVAWLTDHLDRVPWCGGSRSVTLASSG